jgi:hypothetical protein
MRKPPSQGRLHKERMADSGKELRANGIFSVGMLRDPNVARAKSESSLA